MAEDVGDCRHRRILDRAPDVVVVLDDQARVRDAGGAIERLLGRSPRELVGTSALDHVHPADREAVASALLGAMAVDTPGMPVELRLLGRDGESVPVEAVGCQTDLGVIVSLRDQRERESRMLGLSTQDLRYRALAAAARDAIVTVDDAGRIWSWNEGARRTFGYLPEEAIGAPLSVVLPGGLPPEGEVVEADARADDGRVVPVELSVSSYEYIGFTYRLAILRDISERRAAQAAAAVADRRFRTAFDAAPIGMVLVALDGTIMQANEAMARIVGYDRSELVGMHYAAITHPDDLAADEEASRRLLETQRPTRLEKRYRRSDGNLVWVALSVSIVFDDDGMPDHCVAQVEDITERKALDDALAHQARHDHLTGLLNRHALDVRLEQAMGRRHTGPLTVLFIDLDDFKDVNDSHGHSIGDDVLRVVADRIVDALRPQDVAARIGGDEFVALLEGIAGEQAEAVAARLTRSIAEPVRIAGGGWAQVTASVGVATTGPGDVDAADVLARADAAMYASKRARSLA
jgi:diguanylate cyclase (GGDEF)-like protein/PAS domain S-box-containing protein